MRLVVATTLDDPLAAEFWRAYDAGGGPAPAAVMFLHPQRRASAWRRIAEGLLLFGPRDLGRAWITGRRVRALLARAPQDVFRGGGTFHRVASLNRGEGLAALTQAMPDLLVSVGSPEIFRPHVLRMASIGAINVHNGRLPTYRGLFGTFWEVARGEEWGYACIHVMQPEVDAGPVLAQGPVRLAGRGLWEVLVAKKRLGGMLLARLARFAEWTGKLPPACPYNADQPSGYYSWPSLREIGRMRLSRWWRDGHRGRADGGPAAAWPVEFFSNLAARDEHA